jgi:hypothetical protein
MVVRNQFHALAALSREKKPRVPIQKKQGETTADLDILRAERNLLLPGCPAISLNTVQSPPSNRIP